MGSQDIAERAVVGSFRPPADDDMSVAAGEDLLDVKVQIGKRGDIQLEELPRPVVPREGRGKGIRFPRRLRV